jgi:hypothetical protein
MIDIKHRIMEVLLTTNNKLSKSDIDWAIANIPNETIKEPLPFDHNQPKVFEACGLPNSMCSTVMDEYRKIKSRDDIEKKSQIIEAIMNTGSDALIRSFVVRGVMEYEEGKESALEGLKKFLDKLKDED